MLILSHSDLPLLRFLALARTLPFVLPETKLWPVIRFARLSLSMSSKRAKSGSLTSGSDGGGMCECVCVQVLVISRLRSTLSDSNRREWVSCSTVCGLTPAFRPRALLIGDPSPYRARSKDDQERTASRARRSCCGNNEHVTHLLSVLTGEWLDTVDCMSSRHGRTVGRFSKVRHRYASVQIRKWRAGLVLKAHLRIQRQIARPTMKHSKD